jgi:hypothetical protein
MEGQYSTGAARAAKLHRVPFSKQVLISEKNENIKNKKNETRAV